MILLIVKRKYFTNFRIKINVFKKKKKILNLQNIKLLITG